MTTSVLSRSPEDTLALIQPFLKKIGVSRLADITGLDSIGVPVFSSVRPDSQSLVVDSGKGTTREQAKCSAAMESIERWVLDEVPIVSSPLHPKHEKSLLFPLNLGACVGRVEAHKWTEAIDLDTEEIVQIPYYVVKMYTGAEKLVERPWYVTSNGMSAGNTRDEAILSGLYECIERDGTHMAIWTSLNGVAMRKLDLDSIDFPVCQDFVEKIHHSGCDLFVYDARNEIGAPCFMCLIADRDKGLGLWRGYGCHHDSEIALTRAICETIQTRCLLLSGTRDDITWARHRKLIADSQKDYADRMRADKPTISMDDIAGLEEGSVFGIMKEKGFRVLVVDFDIPENPGIAVVKVLIPGFASYWRDYSEMGRPAHG